MLDPKEAVLFVAMTRDNAVWRLPFMRDGSVSKVGRFCSLFGPSGPDGMTMDKAGRLFVAHASLGHVFVFAPNGECIARIKSCAGQCCTNVAIGGASRDRLYITKSVTGTVLVADISESSHCEERSDEALLSFEAEMDYVASLAMTAGGIMKQNHSARQSDVSVIGQGTWYLDRGDRKQAIAALHRGIELGMTHIDTAEMYGDAELVIADAIAGRRDEMFLVSKVLPSNASRRGTITACERSLKRLKTDRLDCYLLHWRGSYPLTDTVAAFEELKRAGKIRSWGVSNFDADDLDEMLAVSGEGKIACNQVLYHLKERAIEHSVIPWCARHGVAVVAYSPFGHDDFPAPRKRGGKLLARIADAHKAHAAQVALSFPGP